MLIKLDLCTVQLHTGMQSHTHTHMNTPHSLRLFAACCWALLSWELERCPHSKQHRSSSLSGYLYGCIIMGMESAARWLDVSVVFSLFFTTNVASFPLQRHIIRPSSAPGAEAWKRGRKKEKNRWPFPFWLLQCAHWMGAARGEEEKEEEKKNLGKGGKKSMDALRRSYKSTWCVGP